MSSHLASNPDAWAVNDYVGTARQFHANDLEWRRGVWLCRPTDAALVLGSAQDESDVDTDRARQEKIDVVRRRSGGGAVYLDSESTVWIDVVITRKDAHWVDDVSRSALWLGHVWSEVLQQFGVLDLDVYSAPILKPVVSRSVCFAGMASGEVLSAGRKVIGISQRRNRDGARFQCVLYRQWRPQEYAHLFVSQEVQDALCSLDVAEVNCEPGDVLMALAAHLG
ncbi:MAG: lipoate--protein ligase family protein [Ilumatobacteraceae bacterium]|nr:lipoate--protein ligase family protein [Ilumatobacteraceae bacterium]